MMAKWYSGTLGPKASRHLSLGEENPRKTSPRKLVPTGDQTRARCVTSAHATTCSTAVNQSVFCPRIGLLSLPFRISIQSIYHKVVYHVISSAANFLPFTIPSRASFSRQLLFSQWPSQFLFLFFIISSIILSSPTLSNTTAFFILSVYFTCSILLHIRVRIASSRFCSLRRIVQVSALYNATIHAKHFTSLLLSSFPRVKGRHIYTNI